MRSSKSRESGEQLRLTQLVDLVEDHDAGFAEVISDQFSRLWRDLRCRHLSDRPHGDYTDILQR